MDKDKKKQDVFKDEDGPEFEQKLLEEQRKLIKETNPGLHAVFEKYKNFHKKSETKED